MKLELGALPAKVKRYKEILKNTTDYRKDWPKGIKPRIIKILEAAEKKLKLGAKIEVKDNIQNLEAVVYDLGRSSSGLAESVDDSGVHRIMIKSNGALVYQQLFNGKIMVMIMSPSIEGYGEAKPPKMLEILRPEELQSNFILRHLELFLNDITDWEDYDDDLPEKKRNAFSPIGFNTQDPDD